jgi:hypothetical protein
MNGGGVQGELDLRCRKPEGPDADVVQALRNALSDGEWHTARTLLQEHGLNDRELRSIVEFHGEEFVTGNRGYRLMIAATVDEIRESAGRLRAQAEKMFARVVQLECAAHRRLHRAPENLSLN